jgi:hypothetical protein
VAGGGPAGQDLDGRQAPVPGAQLGRRVHGVWRCGRVAWATASQQGWMLQKMACSKMHSLSLVTAKSVCGCVGALGCGPRISCDCGLALVGPAACWAMAQGPAILIVCRAIHLHGWMHCLRRHAGKSVLHASDTLAQGRLPCWPAHKLVSLLQGHLCTCRAPARICIAG